MNEDKKTHMLVNVVLPILLVKLTELSKIPVRYCHLARTSKAEYSRFEQGSNIHH